MTECAICHGSSGEEPSEGLRCCDVCMGKKDVFTAYMQPEKETEPMKTEWASTDTAISMDPGLESLWDNCPECGEYTIGTILDRNHTKICPVCIKAKRSRGQHEPEMEIEPMEEQAIMEITPVVAEAKCPGPCGRTMPLTREHWYSDRSRKTRFKALCKQCQKVKDADAQKRMHMEKKLVQKKAKEIERDSKAMLPMIPTELKILMNEDGSDYLAVTVLDDTIGRYVIVEPSSNSERDALYEPHFVLRTEDQVDRLAETLKAILRQVNATKGV